MNKIYKLLIKSWWQLLIIVLLVGTQTFLQLELPPYIGKIQYILINSPSPLTQVALNNILMLGLKMIGISGIIFLLALGQGLLNSYFVAKMGRIVREKLFIKVENYSLSDLNEFGTASLLTRITNDTRIIQNFAYMINRVFIMSPIFLIMGSIKLWNLDPFYFFIAAGTLPIVLIIMLVTFKISAPMFAAIQQRLDYVTLLFREGLTGVRVVRAFNQEKRENKFFDEANRKMSDGVIKVNNVMAIVEPTVNVFFNLALFGVYVIGFVLFSKTLFAVGDDPNILFSATVGKTIEAAQYIQNIMMSFMMLSFVFIMFPQASASAKRINAVFAIEPKINEPHTPLNKDFIEKGVVKFDDVTFSFSENAHPTLENISLKAMPGTVTAIVGSTGSGKSSIINLLPRFFDVTKGFITIDGHDIRDFATKDLRDQIGFVPQQATLFSGTIRENLKFGNENATDEELYEALKVAQAYSFVNRLDLKLDAVVAQGGKNFSGGQKQRLAIARALVKKPTIYIFDDSFSALDFRTDIRLRTALKKYASNATIFVVAQRVSSIIDATQILVLDDGKIVGTGPHADLLNNCPVYQEIVYSQLDAEEINKSRTMRTTLAKEGN